MYKGADKYLAWPTSWCILSDGENISFYASLVIYINSTNIPPINCKAGQNPPRVVVPTEEEEEEYSSNYDNK